MKKIITNFRNSFLLILIVVLNITVITSPKIIKAEDVIAPDYHTITINYVYKDGSITANEPWIATIPSAYSELPDEVASPVIDGYDADLDKVDLRPYKQGLTEDKIINVTYSPKEFNYTIEYLVENFNGEYVKDDKFTVTGTAKVNEVVTVTKPANSDGFTLDSQEVSLKMPASGQLTLTGKLHRNKYEITFDSNGGSYVGKRSFYYDQDIQLPDSPTRRGYTFDGWDPQLPAKMPANNLNVSAKWIEGDTAYTLRFYHESLDGTYSSEPFAIISSGGKTGAEMEHIYKGSDSIDSVVNYFTQLITEKKLTFPEMDVNANHKYWYYNYAFDIEKMESSNDNLLIKSDGSAHYDFYFKRRVYELVFTGNPSGYKNKTGWYPEIVMDGVTYNRENPYKIVYKHGENISSKFPKTKNITNINEGASNNRTNAFRKGLVWEEDPKTGKKYFMWYNSDVTIPDNRWPFYADTSTKPWTILISIEKDGLTHDQATFTVAKYYLQNIDGQYGSEPDFSRIHTYWDGYSLTSPFVTPHVIEGFSPDESKKIDNPYPSGADNDNKTKAFYVRRINEETGSNSFNTDAIAEVYYTRNKYSIYLYNNNIDPNPIHIPDVYFDKPLPTISQLSQEPTKPAEYNDDYVFVGWYYDVDYTRLFDPNNNDKMPSKDVRLYAKWQLKSELEQLPVKFMDGSQSLKDVSVRYGESLKDVAPQPTKQGYRFVGFTSEGQSDLYDINKPTYRGLTLQVVWQKIDRADVVVKYVDEQNQELFPAKTINDVVVGTTFTQEAQVKEGYLPDRRLKTINVETENNEIIFSYKPFTTVDYKIKYVENTGSEIKELQPATLVTTNKVIDTRNYLPIAGYTPITIQKTLKLSQSAEDNVMVFEYRSNKDAAYKVEYYFDNGSGKYVLQDNLTQIQSGKPGSVVVIANFKERMGNYLFNREKSNLNIIITSDGNAVVKLYYDFKPIDIPTYPWENIPSYKPTVLPATGVK